MPAYRGRIEDDLGAGQGGEPGTFWIPLVPADERAHAAVIGIEGFEAEIARSEVELLVIQRIVWDVHLAIKPEDLAVGIDHHGGVVINAPCAFLKNGGNDRNLRLVRYFGENFCSRPRDRLGQVEQRSVFSLTEILRLEQFRQADDLGTLKRRVADKLRRALHVIVWVGRAMHLHQTNREFVLWALHCGDFQEYQMRSASAGCRWMQPVREANIRCAIFFYNQICDSWGAAWATSRTSLSSTIAISMLLH